MAANKWSIPMDKLAAKVNQRVEEVVAGVTLELFSRVVMRTPVDTGRARANWVASHGAYAVREFVFTDSSGSSTLSRIQQVIEASPKYGTMYLANSLPYAAVLEYGLYPNPPKVDGGKTVGGYSRQAPNGMVRVSIEEVQGILRERLAA